MTLAYIPVPPWSEWQIWGPFALRGYALCIIAGIVAAVLIANWRWVARGGRPWFMLDLVLWAVPFGMVGARLYHVVTDYGLYFGEGRNPWRIFAITDGGLGIWGAIAMGALGVWIACRRAGVSFAALADAAAPGLAIAQAIGRIGNWFNQELFGRPTDVPWAVRIEEIKRPPGEDANGIAYTAYETFHPTFLYEALWCVLVALLVIWADRRFNLGHGRAFALYVAAYTVGRAWIEYLRIDEVQMDDIFGMRVNFWVSLLVFLAAVLYMIISSRLRPGREEVTQAADDAAAGADVDAEEGDEVEGDEAEKADDDEAAEAEASGDADAPEPAADDTEETPEGVKAETATDGDDAATDGSDRADAAGGAEETEQPEQGEQAAKAEGAEQADEAEQAGDSEDTTEADEGPTGGKTEPDSR